MSDILFRQTFFRRSEVLTAKVVVKLIGKKRHLLEEPNDGGDGAGSAVDGESKVRGSPVRS